MDIDWIWQYGTDAAVVKANLFFFYFSLANLIMTENRQPTGNAGQLSALLGVTAVDQSQLEHMVHQQAAQDMALHSQEIEHKRLQRVETSLQQKQAQIAKAQTTIDNAKSTASARYLNALDKVTRLEEEVRGLEIERQEIEQRVSEAGELRDLVVPQRRAARMANRQLAGETEEDSGEEEDEYVEVAEEEEEEEEPMDVASAITGIRPPTSVDDLDDGNENAYQRRLLEWSLARWRARNKSTSESAEDVVEIDGLRIDRQELAEEPFLDDPDGPGDYEIQGYEQSTPSLRVPRPMWDRLLEYQRAALKWMYTLHQQNAGGILGDEMGLGKTVQVVAFLASMYHSRLLDRPSIVVCPATLMRQWVREFHAWWPALRVVILHSTGHALKYSEEDPALYDLSSDFPKADAGHRASGSQRHRQAAADNEAAELARQMAQYDSDDDYEYDAYGSRIRRKRKPKGSVDWRRQQERKLKKMQRKQKHAGVVSETARENLKRATQLADRVQRQGHVVLVTYSGLQVFGSVLRERQWGYAVLDEGHMIRNPDAEATLASKRLDTRHRVLVTGTPIQNNLTELWSLFDFIFPGRLGTLPVFNSQFAVPISVGGYATATSLQVRAAYRCACVLRDLIDPYLLRRIKADVAQDLPQKTEQVLFCRLTDMQRDAYKSFLRSPDMERIFAGSLQMLFGVDVARKICDHPDLLLLSKLPSAESTHKEASGQKAEYSDSEEEGAGGSQHLPVDYGDWQKSGKLTIVHALLELWKPQGHRVLVFSQTRQMLDIIERMVSSMPGMVYRRMDGTTPVQHRSAMVDEYNASSEIFVFLLTTKVGGLGVNLTGADRVILYSPDWNPSSDMQARERAWRLGQTRDVAIYRLMAAGTIEEKIYNRQIYKQFLSNKILLDPKQKRFFHSQSLRDLFSLEGFDANETALQGISDAAAQSKAGKRRAGKEMARAGPSDDEATPITETGRMFANAQVIPEANDQRRQPDIEAIGGVVRLESHNQRNEDSSDQDESSTDETNGEHRVLQSLFKMSGVHSALRHDDVVNSKDDDTEGIEREAAGIARQAHRQLKESQRSRRQQDIRIPTWTGMSGQAGMPQARDGERLTSSTVVAPTPSAMTQKQPTAKKPTLAGLRALGKPRRQPNASTGDSIVYNPRLLAGESFGVIRQLPTSSAVASLSLSRGTKPPRPTFGSGQASGMYKTKGSGGGGLSSTDLLAGLRARSSDVRPSDEKTSSTRITTIRKKHHPYQRDAAGDVTTGKTSLGDREGDIVRRIRSYLVDNGGQATNMALIKHFQSDVRSLARFRELAQQVARMETKHPAVSAHERSIGVKHAPQKVWKLL